MMPSNMSKSMDVLTMRLRLEQEHGERAPAQWSRAQLLARLTELEGEDIMAKKTQTLSPLRLAEIELNKMSKKKSVLIEYVQNTWDVSITGNETVDQLKVKAMSAALAELPGHPKDHCGFGQHAALTYEQVVQDQPGYCKWVLETVKEGDACQRMVRLASWLLTEEAQSLEVKSKDTRFQKIKKEMTKNKYTNMSDGKFGHMAEHLMEMPKSYPKSSSSEEKNVAELQKTVEALTKEIQDLKDGKETRRKIQASEEGGTTKLMEQ